VSHKIKETSPGKETEETLESMVKDLHYSYNQIVGSLKPFYNDITNESTFNQNFTKRREEFRLKYTDDSGEIDPYKLRDLKMNCDEVSYQLHILYKNHKFRGFPIGFVHRRKLKKIVELLWMQDDGIAKKNLLELFKYINQELSNANSFGMLQQFLADLRPYYDKLNRDLIDLEHDYPEIKTT